MRQFLLEVRAGPGAAFDGSVQEFGQRPDATRLGSPIFNPLDTFAAAGPLGSGGTVEILCSRRPMTSVLRFVEFVSRLSHVTLPSDVVCRREQTGCPRQLRLQQPSAAWKPSVPTAFFVWTVLSFTNQASDFSRWE